MNDIFRYYAGTTTSKTILKDISKVLCTGVKTAELKNTKGEILKEKQVIIDKNFDVVYPAPIKTSKELIDVMDWNNLTPEEYEAKINNQLSQITDTVILKTTTTKKDVSKHEDDIGLSENYSADKITVYVEMYKPKYLIDTEQYNVETERKGILPYIITKDMYKQYISKQGIVDLDMKARLSGNASNNAITIDYVADSGSSSVSILESESSNYEIVKNLSTILNDTYHTTNSLYQVDNTQESLSQKWYKANYSSQVDISYDTLQLILNNSDILSEYINKLYKPSDINKQYSAAISIDKEEYSYKANLTLKWTRQVERWKISKDFEYKLPQGNRVDPTTIAISYEKNGSQSGDLTSKFEIVKDNSGITIKCKEAIQSNTEYLGDPILYYKYTKDKSEIEKKLILNNNCIFIRMFDKLNIEKNGPSENIYDENTGKVVKINSNVSEWSKLCWYKDFEEEFIDDLDDDIDNSNVSEGIVNLPIETVGLNSETKINFWINTNNDRAIIVLMGNPSLMFAQDRHLLSNAYIGTIENFENSINDVEGNFALYTSSSTIPCLSKLITKKISQNMSSVLGIGDGETRTYSVSVTNGEYDNSAISSVTYEINGNKTTLEKDTAFNLVSDSEGKVLTVTFSSTPELGAILTLNYAVKIPKTTTKPGIIRDELGNITTINYPDTYGNNTATGVTDISMLSTSSKVYFQKHHMMFATPEEFLTKYNYGKSAYTGEFYADKIKVIHGNDGPRGMLQGMLAIDSSSLYAFDELIVNKEFSKDPKADEEIYVYFPITAPYSPFANSPNDRFGIAVKKSYTEPEPTDPDALYKYATDKIYSIVGNFKNLTNDIYVPNTLDYGVTVSWSSDNTEAISFTDNKDGNTKGTVTRPLFGDGDTELTITATINIQDKAYEQKFDASVKESGMSDAQRVAHDKATLELAFDKNNVKNNVTLQSIGDLGCTISWVSSNDATLNDKGIVNRPSNGNEAEKVTITATISYGSASDTKKFEVTVLPWTTEEEVENDLDSFTWDTIKGNNTERNAIIYNLVLSTSSKHGCTIAWSSTNETALATDGTVTRPAYKLGDVSPVLQVKVSKGDYSKLKTFSGLKILKMPITNTEAAQIAINSLEASDFLGSNVSLDEVTGTFALPSNSTATDCSTVTFTWTIVDKEGGSVETTSKYASINKSVSPILFEVTSPTAEEDNAIVYLKVVSTSTALAGSTASSYKTFTITILKTLS